MITKTIVEYDQILFTTLYEYTDLFNTADMELGFKRPIRWMRILNSMIRY